MTNTDATVKGFQDYMEGTYQGQEQAKASKLLQWAESDDEWSMHDCFEL